MIIHGIGKPEGCKLIRVDAEIENEVILKMAIRGDFFAVPEEAFEGIEKRIAPVPLDELARKFDALLIEDGIQVFGIHGQALFEIIQGALNVTRV
ncbi:hypothetical protein MASR2M78_25570 [Treponema sp.]